MLTLRPGSHATQLVELLSVAGEFPWRSLHIIGNERVIKALVHKLTAAQDIRTFPDGDIFSGKLLQLSGQGNSRTVRFHKSALPVLSLIHSDALASYQRDYHNPWFPGDDIHKMRNHRVAEAIAMCQASGFEFRPYALPALQNKRIAAVLPNSPCYYIARDIKKVDPLELNKTTYTRIVGALFYPGGAYAVYNTRNAVMKWNGNGEIKAAEHLAALARFNAGVSGVKSAVLFGKSPNIALQTLIQSDTGRRSDTPFGKLYPQIHFVPLNSDGTRLLKLLTTPDWKPKLLAALFDDAVRTKRPGFMEYDAYQNGKYLLAHFDSDIARLVRFRDALVLFDVPGEVLCYSWQVEFLQKYLGPKVNLAVIDRTEIEEAVF